jgi:hypothetical protein
VQQRSTSGDPKTPVAAVTMHYSVSVGDSNAVLTHNYVPGPYRGPLIIDIDRTPSLPPTPLGPAP